MSTSECFSVQRSSRGFWKVFRRTAIAPIRVTAKKAVALTKGLDARMLQTLALALGEDDEPKEAVAACETALKVISKQEQPDAQLKADLEASLRRFKRALGNQ